MIKEAILAGRSEYSREDAGKNGGISRERKCAEIRAGRWVVDVGNEEMGNTASTAEGLECGTVGRRLVHAERLGSAKVRGDLIMIVSAAVRACDFREPYDQGLIKTSYIGPKVMVSNPSSRDNLAACKWEEEANKITPLMGMDCVLVRQTRNHVRSGVVGMKMHQTSPDAECCKAC